MSTTLPFSDLDYARDYFLDRCNELLAVTGTPWIFAGAACLIEYMSKLVNSGRAGQQAYVQFIRDNMPNYRDFRYLHSNPVRRRSVTRDHTNQDLPEQMYYVLRCGLLHRFSVIPDPEALSNGGRDRSIVMIHRAEATQVHLSNYQDPPLIRDASYFVAEDFIDDIEQTIRRIFLDTTNHPNIIACLNREPPVFLLG